VHATGIGWQPTTVQAMRAGGCAVVRCWDEWLRCWPLAAMVDEAGVVNPAVRRTPTIAATGLMLAARSF